MNLKSLILSSKHVQSNSILLTTMRSFYFYFGRIQQQRDNYIRSSVSRKVTAHPLGYTHSPHLNFLLSHKHRVQKTWVTGTPCYEGSVQNLVENACQEAEIYKDSHVEGVLLENMHDVPYVQPKDMQPEVTAIMTRVCTEVRKVLPTTIKCGVQVLAGGNKEALSIALAAGLQFIRVEGFVFSHVADEGFTDATAGTLLRYRANIRADDVLIFTDIKKKHSAHAITSDVSLQETAKAAEFFLSDGIIITGATTGDPVDTGNLHDVKQKTRIPVLIGSGVTLGNINRYMEANAVIVGTHLKENGRWQNSVDHCRVQRFMDEIHKLRSY